jgi:hypothetical protein
MNSMNEQRFFDLAMKAIGRHGTDSERSELEAMISAQPELRAEFDRLKADARLAKEILPLAGAAESTSGEFPAYARERLQTKVRETLGETQRATAGASKAKWRWLLGFAGAAVIALAFFLTQWPTSTAPIVEVAMLDSGGLTRGGDTNEVALLKQHWSQGAVRRFEKPEDLRAWEGSWPGANGLRVKVIYDRTAGEVRLLGRSRGGTFEKLILVEKDLTTALREAETFIQQQTRR